MLDLHGTSTGTASLPRRLASSYDAGRRFRAEAHALYDAHASLRAARPPPRDPRGTRRGSRPPTPPPRNKCGAT